MFIPNIGVEQCILISVTMSRSAAFFLRAYIYTRVHWIAKLHLSDGDKQILRVKKEDFRTNTPIFLPLRTIPRHFCLKIQTRTNHFFDSKYSLRASMLSNSLTS